MNHVTLIVLCALVLPVWLVGQRGCTSSQPTHDQTETGPINTADNDQKAQKEKAMDTPDTPQIPQTEREWKQKLDRKQYYVLREKGTERPFTGKYDKFYKDGAYQCAGCGQLLFISDSKFNSGCGWPAFSAPADETAVSENRDTSHGMIRTEITCSKCGGHLGHVFNDGPGPTGLRYCINSAALDFEREINDTVDD